MKFKKILISASAIAAGSGLLATVLTSCAKANIDKKLRIELDSAGNLYKPGKMTGKTFDWKTVITNALTHSTNWTQFKNAIADEIVYTWYEDRAETKKGAGDGNAQFRTNIDEWNYQIKKDYDSIVQTCKNKYGANWEFYLTNEYLAPNGGSYDSYRKNKLIDKVKTEFVTKVFAKNYFGFRDNENPNDILPFAYTKASRDVAESDLCNPANWKKIGFYARTDLGFPVLDKDMPTAWENVNTTFLAKHPEGDYAAIQDYVFNRWFKTEKPFFSAAALFKYTLPSRVAGGKLDQIYNTTRTGVKLPDKPNEYFPFFGAGDDGSTRKAIDFFNNMSKGSKYATKYKDTTGEHPSNHTVTISLSDTDDTQTLLLVSGNQMFAGLYTPYAIAAGNLYEQMMGRQTASSNPNSLDASVVKARLDAEYTGIVDDFAMLGNFFYTNASSIPSGVTNYLDLNDIYGTAGGTKYHCPLFCDCPTYNYFYGATGATETDGVRYITNNIQLTKFNYSTDTTDVQPWVMELNESGVHFQTIDGFNYVNTASDKQEALKEVVKYRLMQKQVDNAAAKCISTDLLGESGKLKTYFNDNFADIIIELAKNTTDVNHQVFRKIKTYKTGTVLAEDLLLYKVWDIEKFKGEFTNLSAYLDAIVTYDETKKIFTNLDAVNSKIFSYRSKHITNSKSKEDFSRTIFENGLSARFVYAPSSTIHSTRDYVSVNRLVVQNLDSTILDKGYNQAMHDLEIKPSNAFIAGVIAAASVDGATGFSPQIKSAKAKMSNRFWYSSRLVDKVLHTFMANKASTANGIKMNAFDYYQNNVVTPSSDWTTKFAAAPAAKALATTYKRSKLLSGDKNLSTYVGTLPANYSIANFYTTMNTEFDKYMDRETINNGSTSDENMNYELFKATLMYLVGSEKGAQGKDFDNFYTLFNSKINEDEAAITGYLARGYASGAGTLSDTPIQYMQDKATAKYCYDFDANVDNEYDKIGYAGGKQGDDKTNSKISSASYWTAVETQIKNIDREFNGFLGLQTKSSNQLDAGSGLQATVFDTFPKSIINSYNLDESAQGALVQYKQHSGCWFKFAGKLDNNQQLITWKDDALVYDDGTTVTSCKANEWFPENSKYAPVRKIANKIITRRTTDDLRTIAKALGDSFDGASDFEVIGSGRIGFKSIEEMKMKMLKLLPSALADDSATRSAGGFEKAEDICCFSRVKNAEAHTDEVDPSYVFKDSKARTSYRLLLTQINKADVIEHNLAPTWNTDHWEQGNSPLTPEEFFVLFFNLAMESTVQQRAITKVVETTFGDEKLIVYDAQLYNQFDSVWIKDWTKKTMGA